MSNQAQAQAQAQNSVVSQDVRPGQAVADWEWADSVIRESAWADFQVDDSEFDPDTGEHRFFDEDTNCVAVDVNGHVFRM